MAFKMAELLVDLSLVLLLEEAYQILNSFFHPQKPFTKICHDYSKIGLYFVLLYGSCMYLRVNKKLCEAIEGILDEAH